MSEGSLALQSAPTCRLIWFLAAAVAASGWSALAAQQPISWLLHGLVRDSATSAPLPGVVVSVVDSGGITLARTIAGAEGRFTIVIVPRAVRLHLIRIGYGPRDVSIPVRRDQRVEVAMMPLPAMLDVVRVSDHELCPGATDRGAAFQLWEQARAGLLATIVAREAMPAKAQILGYDRHTSRSGDRVVQQTTHASSGETSRPFVAFAPASTFARTGYMEEDPSGRTFSAPDADVLLDESFASTHCFHIQSADDDHRGQIGLAFAPVPSGARDTLVDVTGVIWIDGLVPQVRSLDFLYTALEPAATEANAGGHLEFRTMPNGIAFVERWHLRLPVVGGPPLPTRALRSPYALGDYPPMRRRQDRRGLRLVEIVEAGGVVVEATWPDGVSWHDPPTGISGSVTQGRSKDGVPNALVALVGTNDTTVTDANGHFTLVPVIPGTYTIAAVDTVLRDFVSERTQETSVKVAQGQVSQVRLTLSPRRETTDRVCGGQRMPAGTSMIVGYLTLPDSVSPRALHVHAGWQLDPSMTSADPVEPVVERDIEVDGKSRFVACGVARHRPVRLQLVRGAAVLAETIVTPDERLVTTVNWRLP